MSTAMRARAPAHERRARLRARCQAQRAAVAAGWTALRPSFGALDAALARAGEIRSRVRGWSHHPLARPAAALALALLARTSVARRPLRTLRTGVRTVRRIGRWAGVAAAALPLLRLGTAWLGKTRRTPGADGPIRAAAFRGAASPPGAAGARSAGPGFPSPSRTGGPGRSS